jgi:hypothetical protein
MSTIIIMVMVRIMATTIRRPTPTPSRAGGALATSPFQGEEEGEGA